MTDSPADPSANPTSPNPTSLAPSKTASKPPTLVFETIFAFPPNRDTLGGTAYLVQEEAGNILVDCPAWDETVHQFLQSKGGVRWLFLTHRGGMGKVSEIQQAFHCEVLMQEQEAYLLPGLAVTTFQREFLLSPTSTAIWTCGHSPGSSCLYHQPYGGVLFSGRHLLPNAQGVAAPLRISKTFHWPRQIQNVQLLRERFTTETLSYICPGANTGFLRGKRVIESAYAQLTDLDIEACLQAKPLL
jgi:glyoxylase-like metal-dependent hydrolase (beta-lactamase superfamily II)